MTTLFVILGIIVALAVLIIGIYNRLVGLRQTCNQAWSDIEVQLKQRQDLIPNLVKVVKGYAKHEKTTLKEVIDARNAAVSAGGVGDTVKAEGMLTQALGKMFALAEAYPDLKANTNFLELQRELSDTENKIQAARRFFNGNVRDLNIALQSFPSNIVGNMFSFKAEEYFELEEGSEEKENVKVEF